MNGQNCRSGGWVPDWFEGGQTPLFRRLPKLKGFTNAKFMTHYNVINLTNIEDLAAKGITEITKEVLFKVSLKISSSSASAKEAVEKAWGSIELI